VLSFVFLITFKPLEKEGEEIIVKNGKIFSDLYKKEMPNYKIFLDTLFIIPTRTP